MLGPMVGACVGLLLLLLGAAVGRLLPKAKPGLTVLSLTGNAALKVGLPVTSALAVAIEGDVVTMLSVVGVSVGATVSSVGATVSSVGASDGATVGFDVACVGSRVGIVVTRAVGSGVGRGIGRILGF